jgi:activator of 2-hydroxyglutaryl-CoA dehydratase
MNAPWVHFEAGALSISQFQATEMNKKDVLTLLGTINTIFKEYENNDPVLDNRYNKFWQDIDKKLESLKVDEQQRLKEDETGYYIGIDIGKSNIEYCLMDYSKFKDGNNKEDGIVEESCGSKESPSEFENIYSEVNDIFNKLVKVAHDKGIPYILAVSEYRYLAW